MLPSAAGTKPPGHASSASSDGAEASAFCCDTPMQLANRTPTDASSPQRATLTRLRVSERRVAFCANDLDCFMEILLSKARDCAVEATAPLGRRLTTTCWRRSRLRLR